MSSTTNKAVKAMADEIQHRLEVLTVRDTAHFRHVRREFSNRINSLQGEGVVSLGLELLKRNVPEFFVYELVQHHKPALLSIETKSLELLGRGLNSWVAVDTFASFLAGPAWRERQVPDALIKRWAHSPDRWWRRAALVSTVPLNNNARGGRGDSARTIMICRLLIDDRDDMVVKALSWALRELAKQDTEAVVLFLREHKEKLASRVIREVGNKISTGLKNPPPRRKH